MKLFKTKVWSAVDIGLLKWSCILVGMIAGAYLADFTKRNVWLFAVAAVLLAIKPTLSYFGQDTHETDAEPTGPQYQIEKAKKRK